jgi:hypothetical protein
LAYGCAGLMKVHDFGNAIPFILLVLMMQADSEAGMMFILGGFWLLCFRVSRVDFLVSVIGLWEGLSVCFTLFPLYMVLPFGFYIGRFIRRQIF